MESYRSSRSLSRIPSSPPAPEEDELFHQYFDWSSYCQETGQDFGSLPSPPSSITQSSWQLPEDYYQVSKELAGAESYPIDAFSLETLQSDFYRMNASFRSDEDEAPSPPSDYTTPHSPPELVTTGSASPSEHSGSSSSVVDATHDAHYARIALSEAKSRDDEWTYPQGERSPKPLPVGYPSHVQLHDARSPEAVANLKRRRSSNEVEKRHRQLADPMQTADVRKSGACVPCRVSKIRVSHWLLPTWAACKPSALLPKKIHLCRSFMLTYTPSCSAMKVVCVPRAGRRSRTTPTSYAAVSLPV